MSNIVKPKTILDAAMERLLYPLPHKRDFVLMTSTYKLGCVHHIQRDMSLGP